MVYMYYDHNINHALNPNCVHICFSEVYCRPIFKYEDAINAIAIFFFLPDSQLLEMQLKHYIRGDESRRAQNAVIEFAITLKT